MVNQFIQLSDNVVMQDLGGQEYNVVKMHCNITSNKGYGLTIDILDQTLYLLHLEECTLKIKEFRAIAEQKAADNGITVV